jgi:dihydropteroate synthase
MGILNVTPDSFSDGGKALHPEAAVAAGLRMAEDGADIIDIGGESTRPDAGPVPPEEEQRRIVPVIGALAAHGLLISADTRNAATMRAALGAGAAIVNDVSGLAHDPDAAAAVAAAGCPVVLMHMRGTPATMSSLAVYGDAAAEVTTELMRRVAAARAAGIAEDRIAIDPGIGFAKAAGHSVAVLRGLRALAGTGYPVVAGVSRKSFIGRLSNEPDAARRLGGSLAAALFALSRGAAVLRVHDVRETVQAIRVWHALSD